MSAGGRGTPGFFEVWPDDIDYPEAHCPDGWEPVKGQIYCVRCGTQVGDPSDPSNEHMDCGAYRNTIDLRCKGCGLLQPYLALHNEGNSMITQRVPD